MHLTKNRAEPYLHELELDCNLAYESEHLNKYKIGTEQGIAVVGYSPNVLIVAKEAYMYWKTLEKLISCLHTGKVGICASGQVPDLETEWTKINAKILVKVFSSENQKDCFEWLSN